nr:AraC family transcriptional regulator [bacterium]
MDNQARMQLEGLLQAFCMAHGGLEIAVWVKEEPPCLVVAGQPDGCHLAGGTLGDIQCRLDGGMEIDQALADALGLPQQAAFLLGEGLGALACYGIPTQKISALGQALAAAVAWPLVQHMQLQQARREAALARKRIDGLKQDSRRVEQAARMLESGREYPLYTERALCERVGRGDRAGARQMLNQWLGNIFFGSSGEYEVIRARVLELVVVLSRAAVEGGARLEKLLGMNLEFVSEVGHIDQFDDLCDWLVRVLDQIMDAVYATRSPGSDVLAQAMAYIERHFDGPLTLEQVAKEVHVSRYHLSHLFTQRMKTTFLQAVTHVRLQAAQDLLLATRLPIAEVAARCGYEDAGYFTRVFKRQTGVTPAAWRKTPKAAQ